MSQPAFASAPRTDAANVSPFASQDHSAADRPLVGISTIIRMFYAKQDVTAVWDGLVARAKADPGDVPALMDLSLLLQSTGPKGLEMQAAAVKMQPVFRRVHGTGQGLRVAAFMVAGDMTANTPIDFLLEGSDMVLYLVYLDAKMEKLPDIPPVDVAYLAIGESPANRAVLANAERLLTGWHVKGQRGAPILNFQPARIAAMTRDHLHDVLVNEPSILSPKLLRVTRVILEALTFDTQAGPAEFTLHDTPFAFPIIIRPIGTHAGDGMEKIDDVEALRTYLAASREACFYVSAFVNCADSEGLYRKQRIAFIQGKPYASHLAVSSHWMVHYLSAEMDQHAVRRAEEARWMATFDSEFAPRYKQAFAALVKAFDLDYFVIDCAELPDGRLLLFEADVIMIVHDMDSEEVFPYKKPIMRKLFRAFQDALTRAANAGAAADLSLGSLSP